MILIFIKQIYIKDFYAASSIAGFFTNINEIWYFINSKLNYIKLDNFIK